MYLREYGLMATISSTEKERTSILSIRLKESIKKKLELESELHEVNLNNLISQIIANHLDWDRYTKDIGYVFVSRRFMRAVIEKFTIKDLETLAENINGPSLRDAAIFINGEFSYSALIKTLNQSLEASDVPYRIYSDSGLRYVLQHKLGDKWPAYFINSIEKLFSEVGYGLKDIQGNDESLSFEIVKVNC